MPTRGASLARWDKPIDGDDGFPVACGLGFQQAPGDPDRRVGQTAGEGVVSIHAPRIEIFQINHVKPFHEVRRELVQGILSSISDAFMEDGDPVSSGVLPPAAFLFPGEPSLEHCQAACLATKGISLPVLLLIRMPLRRLR